MTTTRMFRSFVLCSPLLWLCLKTFFWSSAMSFPTGLASRVSAPLLSFRTSLRACRSLPQIQQRAYLETSVASQPRSQAANRQQRIMRPNDGSRRPGRNLAARQNLSSFDIANELQLCEGSWEKLLDKVVKANDALGLSAVLSFNAFLDELPKISPSALERAVEAVLALRRRTQIWVEPVLTILGRIQSPSQNLINIAINAMAVQTDEFHNIDATALKPLDMAAKALHLRQQALAGGMDLTNETYDALLFLLAEAGRPDDAISVFEQFVTEGRVPAPSAFAHIVTAYRNSGDLFNAQVWFMNYRQSDLPKDRVVYFALVRAQVQLGRKAEAIDLVERIMREDGLPPNTMTYNTLLDAFSSSGDFASFNEYYSKLMAGELTKPTLSTHIIALRAGLANNDPDLVTKAMNVLTQKNNVSNALRARAPAQLLKGVIEMSVKTGNAELGLMAFEAFREQQLTLQPSLAVPLAQMCISESRRAKAAEILADIGRNFGITDQSINFVLQIVALYGTNFSELLSVVEQSSWFSLTKPAHVNSLRKALANSFENALDKSTSIKGLADQNTQMSIVKIQFFTLDNVEAGSAVAARDVKNRVLKVLRLFSKEKVVPAKPVYDGTMKLSDQFGISGTAELRKAFLDLGTIDAATAGNIESVMGDADIEAESKKLTTHLQGGDINATLASLGKFERNGCCPTDEALTVLLQHEKVPRPIDQFVSKILDLVKKFGTTSSLGQVGYASFFTVVRVNGLERKRKSEILLQLLELIERYGSPELIQSSELVAQMQADSMPNTVVIRAFELASPSKLSTPSLSQYLGVFLKREQFELSRLIVSELLKRGADVPTSAVESLFKSMSSLSRSSMMLGDRMFVENLFDALVDASHDERPKLSTEAVNGALFVALERWQDAKAVSTFWKAAKLRGFDPDSKSFNYLLGSLRRQMTKSPEVANEIVATFRTLSQALPERKRSPEHYDHIVNALLTIGGRTNVDAAAILLISTVEVKRIPVETLRSLAKTLMEEGLFDRAEQLCYRYPNMGLDLEMEESILSNHILNNKRTEVTRALDRYIATFRAKRNQKLEEGMLGVLDKALLHFVETGQIDSARKYMVVLGDLGLKGGKEVSDRWDNIIRV
ncbi:hypothetical protein BJ742DRAFT_900535 [Cladochytrium replicatum]|nr:hypothetical protein BJ742DRAFT_900535 [Cladochytrium replicatum]